MKNYIRIILSSLLLIWATPSNAEFNFGVGLIVGQVDSDGTETEGTAADTSTRAKSFEESFVGADIFAEYVYNGYTLGVTYIPIEKDVGSGTRTDVSGDGNENDSGDRSASAELEDMYSIYTNIPFGGTGFYGLLAYNEVDVITSETLPTSTYGNISIDGYSYGIGFKSGAMKFELFHTDFDDFSISASTDADSSNSVAGDIDATTLRMTYGF